MAARCPLDKVLLVNAILTTDELRIAQLRHSVGKLENILVSWAVKAAKINPNFIRILSN